MIYLKTISSATLCLILFMGVLSSGCKTKQGDSRHASQNNPEVYYTCSMHPQVHEDNPGNCPICGMQLIRVAPPAKEDTLSVDTALAYLVQSPGHTVVGHYTVITPTENATTDTISADGEIQFDQSRKDAINVRVAGRIDKLFVQYTHESVRKGQVLMTIYSPELISAQRDLLQVIGNEEDKLVEREKMRLLNMGMTESEIQKVIRMKKPMEDFTIYSPYQGIAIPRNEEKTWGIHKGMYVNKGQTLFFIQNESRKWAVLNVLTRDITQVKQGDTVLLFTEADPGNKMVGKVDFIPPYREKKMTQARIYLRQVPDNWKIGSLIRGQIIHHPESTGLYIPLTAVNRLGRRDIVWKQDEKKATVFYAHKVQLGHQLGNQIRVIAGLSIGDKIAANAAYMVGSDSYIQ